MSAPDDIRGEGAPGVIARLLEAEQERWFCWLPVLIGAGIGLYFSLADEPSLAMALTPLAALVALRAAGAGKELLAGLALSALLAVAAGLALAKLRVEWVRAPVLSKQMNAAEVRGYVELVEPRTQRGARLTLRVIDIAGLAPAVTPARVRVTLSRAHAGLQPGSAVRLRATLMPPLPPATPGDYDFGRQLWFARLGAVGYALSPPALDASATPPALDLAYMAQVQRLRLAIGERIAAALPGERGAIATALITGERGGITEATNDAFRDSGIVHILSISGFHMAIMAGSVFLAVRFALALFPAIALRYPIKKWAAGAAMLATLAYLAISGGAFATVRSAIMIAIMFLAVLLDRPAVTLRNVVLAATAILVVFPESLLDVGFQMSFAAVLALVCAYEALRRRAWWGELMQRPGARLAVFFAGIVLSTLVASAAVAPFAAYHFHKSQQYAVIANLIALPVCNIVVMPAALAALIAMPLGLEALPLWVMGWGIDAMVWTAQRVARLPGAVIAVPAMPTLAFLMMIGGGLWLMLWQTRWRLAGVAAIAAGLALAPTLRGPDILVGRDAAAVAVRTEQGTLATLAAARTSYEVQRWLEQDGGAAEEAGKLREAAFACDAIGCRARVKGLTLAVVRHPAAFDEDCRQADIVVSALVAPRDCTRPRASIDFFAARRSGAHALYVDPGGAVRIETVAEKRGHRPWSSPAASAQPSATAETLAGAPQ